MSTNFQFVQQLTCSSVRAILTEKCGWMDRIKKKHFFLFCSILEISFIGREVTRRQIYPILVTFVQYQFFFSISMTLFDDGEMGHNKRRG